MKEGIRNSEIKGMAVVLLHEHIVGSGAITMQIQDGKDIIVFEGMRLRLLTKDYRYYDHTQHEVVDESFSTGNQATDHIVEVLN